MSQLGILTDWVEAEAVASELNTCKRTIIRWMDQPDGLPFSKVGNRRYVHLPTAREWLFNRMRRPNRRRERKAQALVG